MDKLGHIVREFIKQARKDEVRTALGLATELKQEGMLDSEVKEMLSASGFEEDIILDALGLLSGQE